jgi:hypothetical protein
VGRPAELTNSAMKKNGMCSPMKPTKEARQKSVKGNSLKTEKWMMVLRGRRRTCSRTQAHGIERVAGAMKPVIRVAQP